MEAKLRQLLTKYFNLNEMRNLCQDMGIDHEEIPHKTKSEFARELVKYCNRYGELPQLVQQCRTLRPYVTWPDVFSSTRPNKTSNFLTPKSQDWPSIDYKPRCAPAQRSPRAIQPAQRKVAKSSKKSAVQYRKLGEMLQEKRWRDADYETERIILELTNRKLAYPRPQDIAQMSCTDIKKLDSLWREYSDDCFGITVQYQIWQDLLAAHGADSIILFYQFGKDVGWYVNDEWLSSKKAFIFSHEAPPGHLPSLRFQANEESTSWLDVWYDTVKSLMRLVEHCVISAELALSQPNCVTK